MLLTLSKFGKGFNKMFNKKFMLILLALFLLAIFNLIGCGEADEDVIKIGAPIPMTGPYASDGEQMQMALELAIAEKNEAGGLLGRKLELIPGDVGALEAEKIRAVGERLSGEGVHAAITGYADSGVDARVFGGYDYPYLHADAMTESTEVVAENIEEFGNVFQFCPSEISYGYDTAERLFDLPAEMGWEEPNKKVAAIRADYSYNVLASDVFLEGAEAKGYEVVFDDIVQFGIVEWGPILSRLAETEPAYVTFWILDPADAARFITQFNERFGETGYNGIVYMQYTPNIPEFLELAGNNANGVVWSTSVGVVSDDAPAYAERWEEFFGEEPKATYAYSVRDAFEIWVSAVEQAGCVDCYDQIIDIIRASDYTGFSGTYVFDSRDQQALFGDDYIPTLWYQVQDVEHLLVGPDAFGPEAAYIIPPWVK
jgi:branched-chain amino acid transport system substrate-binding protein